MSLAERVTAVRTVREARLRRGDADASAFVLGATNILPSPLQRAIARTSFSSRRFSLIVSVFPGTRQRRQLLGAEVTEVFPILALADGVGLALGAMTWGRYLSVGIMANPALIPDVALPARGIRNAFSTDDRESADLPAAKPSKPARSLSAVAVVLTLVAAFFFGLSSVMEQRSTKQVPQRGALSPRLLVDLARRALWLTAIGVNLVGSVLQVVALHFGALAVVQPIVASDVLFAVLISLLAWRRRPDWVMICCWTGWPSWSPRDAPRRRPCSGGQRGSLPKTR